MHGIARVVALIAGLLGCGEVPQAPEGPVPPVASPPPPTTYFTGLIAFLEDVDAGRM